MRSRPRQAVEPRIVVLLIIGALICLRYLPRHEVPVIKVEPVFWVSASTGSSSFCQFPEGGWLEIYRKFGVALPLNISELPGLPTGFSAYHIDSQKLPEVISLPPSALPLVFQPMPINCASIELLTIIPGIGPSLAAAIVRFRGLNGPFRDKEDLEKVHGIGRQKAQTISRYVSFDL